MRDSAGLSFLFMSLFVCLFVFLLPKFVCLFIVFLFEEADPSSNLSCTLSCRGYFILLTIRDSKRTELEAELLLDLVIRT